MDKAYETQVEVTLKQASVGGLVLFYNEKAFAGISSDGKQFTIYENAVKQINKPNRFGNHFFVKIINTNNKCHMLAGKDNHTWDTLFSDLDVSEMHHNKYLGFFALRPGLMAAGNGSVQNNNFIYKSRNDIEKNGDTS